MARSKGLLGMPVLALTLCLTLGLAAIGLAGCATAADFNKQAADYTHKDAVQGNSAALIFDGAFMGELKDGEIQDVVIVIESIDGETLNWPAKHSIGKGMMARFPLTKGVIPAGKHSYVITTSGGKDSKEGRLEGEMEFISGYAYIIRISQWHVNNGYTIEIKEVS